MVAQSPTLGTLTWVIRAGLLSPTGLHEGRGGKAPAFFVPIITSTDA